MLEIALPVAVIVVLILLNGVFVAAEFAIVGVSRSRVERRARQGNRVARVVRRVLQDRQRQDRFIATAQLGITAASLGLGMYGEHAVAEWIAAGLHDWGWGWERWIAAHSMASVLAVTILTYFHVVIGEMVPKSLALQSPERTAFWVTPLMRTVQLSMYPLVIALDGFANMALRLFGIRRALTEEHFRTPEEIAYIVRQSGKGGLLRRKSAEVVTELLDFGDLTAGEVMVPRVRVVGVPLGAGRAVLRDVLRQAPHTRYPVYEGTLDTIVGVVHVKEVLGLVGSDGTLSRELLHPVPFIPMTAPMDQVLAVMRRAGPQMAVVMDEHGGTAGILTMEDLFEEVVGEISERPDEVPELVLEAEGRARADGAVRVEEVGEALGVVLEREEVDTVSGLVLTLLGRPARVGDVVVYDHVRFEVVAVRGKGVSACVATLTEQDETDQDETEL